MKKILFIAAAICFTNVSYAQIIPKAGVTLSRLHVDEDEGMKSKLGFTLGIGYNKSINDLFSVQPELNFIQKGLKGEFSESSNGESLTLEETYTLNYFELPVLVKVTFGDGTKFFLNAGPSVGIGLGGKYKFKGTYTFQGITESEEIDGKIKFGDASENEEEVYFDNRLDFGVQVGGGAIIAGKIMIDIRYGLGLSNLMDGEDNTSQNRVLQFTIGVPLSLN